MKKKSNTRQLRFTNKPLLIMTLIYAVLGAFSILDASFISATLTYGADSPYFFFTRQLFWIVVSFALAIVVLFIPTKTYRKLSGFLVPFAMFGLIVYFIYNKAFTSGVSDVTLGNVQISEFIKVAMIVYMGAYYGHWVNKKQSNIKAVSIFNGLRPLAIAALAFLIVALGGDFGSASIMLALFALIFISVPSNEKYFKVIKGIAICGMILVIVVLKFGYLIIPQKKLESDYRLNRLIYTNPCDRYESTSGYQVCNGYIAIDNGGLKGSGIGNSVQKYLYLPASHTDFIFPIIIEEFGVIVGIAILVGYMFIAYLTFKIATNCYELQNSIICYGIGIYFLLHIFVNLGGVLGIIPLTGVPLPFLSYGGTYCLCTIVSFAIVQRINIENQIEKRSRERKNAN